MAIDVMEKAFIIHASHLLCNDALSHKTSECMKCFINEDQCSSPENNCSDS